MEKQQAAAFTGNPEREPERREEEIVSIDPVQCGTPNASLEAMDERLVTTLLLAGEAMAAPLRGNASPPLRAAFARPDRPSGSLAGEDFEWLGDIVRQIRTRIAEDPRRAELLARLREAFGDGDTLYLLFRRLFPAQRSVPHRGEDGKPVLSPREVEVLREAAADRTHKEIAERLHISPGVVNNHLNNIYRKLNVRKPMQAVARAISMGYLDLDAMDIIHAAGNASPRDYRLFNCFVSCTADLHQEPFATHFKPLAEFGLLLLLLSKAATDPIGEDANSRRFPRRGVICGLSAAGAVTHTIGAGDLFQVKGIAVAPPQAARHGFTPGHLFVLHDLLPMNGLNRAAIVEFAPEGRLVRSFYGGREIGTRLANGPGLAFAADGRLLAGSSGLTDAILAFSAGGARVQIWSALAC